MLCALRCTQIMHCLSNESKFGHALNALALFALDMRYRLLGSLVLLSPHSSQCPSGTDHWGFKFLNFTHTATKPYKTTLTAFPTSTFFFKGPTFSNIVSVKLSLFRSACCLLLLIISLALLLLSKRTVTALQWPEKQYV